MIVSVSMVTDSRRPNGHGDGYSRRPNGHVEGWERYVSQPKLFFRCFSEAAHLIGDILQFTTS